jgi:hypothetical protein
MKLSALFLFALLAAYPAKGFAASDSLARESFTFEASDPDTVLENTAANPKAVFQRYRPALDSSTKVIRPLRIGGSAAHPTFNMVVKKCVLFVCKEVELDGTVTLEEVSPTCRRNYRLSADLSRSSSLLAENYASLTVNLCYQAAGRSGRIVADAFADRAPTYSGGAVTGEILKMLKLQIEPMAAALHQTLIENGARRVRHRKP